MHAVRVGRPGPGAYECLHAHSTLPPLLKGAVCDLLSVSQRDVHIRAQLLIKVGHASVIHAPEAIVDWL